MSHVNTLRSRVCQLAVIFVAIGSASAIAREEAFKLTPSDAPPVSGFGQSVAISGDRIVVGAPEINAAYIFRREGTGWTEEQKITPSVGTGGDGFGRYVAMEANLIVVGAPHITFFGSPVVGKAFIFRRVGSTWVEEAPLVSSGSEGGDEFGAAVSISQDRVAVGARREGIAPGTAYVFRFDGGGNWVEETRLTPSDAATGGAAFGWSVSIDDDLLVVGAWADNSACPTNVTCNSGAAYIYQRMGTNWGGEVKLVSPNFQQSDLFARSVSLKAGTLAITAEGIPTVYSFTQIGGIWTQNGKLVPPSLESSGAYANSVSTDGNTILVGAEQADLLGLANTGAAHLYCRSGAFLRYVDILQNTNIVAGLRLGFAVDTNGPLAVVGANNQFAYVYDLSDVDPCPLPSVSQWGLCAMGLIFLTAARMVFIHRSNGQMMLA